MAAGEPSAAGGAPAEGGKGPAATGGKRPALQGGEGADARPSVGGKQEG